MVLIGAPSYFPAQARAIMWMFSPTTRTPDEWTAMRARHAHGDDQIRALWRTAAGFADSHDDMAFTPPHLATIRARTLIVTGDRDPLYPLEIFVEQYRAIPAPRCTCCRTAATTPCSGRRAASSFARRWRSCRAEPRGHHASGAER